jgi:calcium-binding protein CML
MSAGAKYDLLIALPEFEPSREEEFRAAFEQVDTDNNHELSKEEFKQFIELTKQTANSKYVFDIIDTDHSGAISLDEFFRFVKALSEFKGSGEPRRYLSLVFLSCDIGKKGTLTQKEFIKFMKYIGHDVGFLNQKKIFKQFDNDGNGTIDFDEILAHLNIIIPKSKARARPNP